MSDQSIEQEIQDKGLNAPRITPSDVEVAITDIEIVKHVSKSGQILRWAVLTTHNGFAVTGKPSCAVSSANDDAAIGEEVAIGNAKAELWPLLGYELRTKLATEEAHRARQAEAESTANRIARINMGEQDAAYSDEELVYAAVARCECGAGMAYPENSGMHGAWHCSDILTLRAAKKDEPGCMEHTPSLPFAFYALKSENQPSANGATTRRRPVESEGGEL